VTNAPPSPAARRLAAPPPTKITAPAPVPAEGGQRPPSGRFAVLSGRLDSAKRVLVYGPGGVGKSTLAALAPNPIVLDVEGSTKGLEVARILDGIETWQGLRECLQSDVLDGYSTIVIDSVTKAEEMAVAHTLLTVPNDRGQRMRSLPEYGFGKGERHLYDTFLHLLMDLDRHVRAGRNVVLVAHVCTTPVPNPMSDDWIQYQPRLQTTKKGDSSIRERTFEWCDHVIFVGFDVAVGDDGKGIGEGTRTIWTSERPTHRAKVRGVQQEIEPRPFETTRDNSIWPLLLGGAR